MMNNYVESLFASCIGWKWSITDMVYTEADSPLKGYQKHNLSHFLFLVEWNIFAEDLLWVANGTTDVISPNEDNLSDNS